MSPAMFLLNDLRIGGSERKVVRVANALHRLGRPVHIGYLGGPHVLRDSIDPGIPVVDFDRRGKFSPKAAYRLATYVRRHGIQHLCCVHLYTLLYAQATAMLLGSSGPKRSCLINTTEFVTDKEARQMTVYAPLLRRTQKLVFGCKYQQELWLERYRLPRHRSRVVHNGVDTTYFAPDCIPQTRGELRNRYGFSDADFVVTIVGQLRREKQQTDLVHALDALHSQGHPVCAMIVGEGEERLAIERLVVEKGLQNYVRMVGLLGDVRPALKAADAFVLTSVAVETFSNAALEAMALGLPAILTDISGAKEMIEPGSNGFLYPPGDVSALATRLGSLAAQRSETRRLGLQARELICRRFGFDSMISAYDRLLYQQEQA